MAEHMLDTLPCGVISFSDDGTITLSNATIRELLGYADDLVGRHFESLLTLPGRIFFQTHFFPLLKLHGKAEEIFLLLRTSDGRDVGALVNAVRRERAGVFVTDCVMVEVRERRKYEDELLRARRDADAAREALAIRNRELEDANELLRDQAAELEAQGEQLEEQATELEAQSDEMRESNEALVLQSEELKQARQAADEANHAKSQFLTTMSHELRTPLNAIGGYVQLIELGIHGPVTDAQREALDRIDRSQRHLLRLINDILNLARIEAGRVEYRLENIRVGEVVASVLPMVEPQMSSAGLTLRSSVPDNLVVNADRDKVQQIMINVLTNAMKFTPRGGRVTIGADDGAACVGGSSERVRITVRDTGIGIPASKLDSIFEPFVQVEVERSQRREGTGLGLAISRDLARAMGGDITVESVPQKGSTFILTLPCGGLQGE